MSNHHVVHLKLTILYINSISIKITHSRGLPTVLSDQFSFIFEGKVKMRSLLFLNTTRLYWDYTSLEEKNTRPCPSQLCEHRKAAWIQGQDEVWEGIWILFVQPSPNLSVSKCRNSYLLSAKIRIMEVFFFFLGMQSFWPNFYILKIDAWSWAVTEFFYNSVSPSEKLR